MATWSTCAKACSDRRRDRLHDPLSFPGHPAGALAPGGPRLRLHDRCGGRGQPAAAQELHRHRQRGGRLPPRPAGGTTAGRAGGHRLAGHTGGCAAQRRRRAPRGRAAAARTARRLPRALAAGHGGRRADGPLAGGRTGRAPRRRPGPRRRRDRHRLPIARAGAGGRGGECLHAVLPRRGGLAACRSCAPVQQLLRRPGRCRAPVAGAGAVASERLPEGQRHRHGRRAAGPRDGAAQPAQRSAHDAAVGGVGVGEPSGAGAGGPGRPAPGRHRQHAGQPAARRHRACRVAAAAARSAPGRQPPAGAGSAGPVACPAGQAGPRDAPGRRQRGCGGRHRPRPRGHAARSAAACCA